MLPVTHEAVLIQRNLAETRAVSDRIDALIEMWFCRRRSNEEMMRGTRNKIAAHSRLHQQAWIMDTHHVRTMGCKPNRALAALPDGIASVNMGDVKLEKYGALKCLYIWG